MFKEIDVIKDGTGLVAIITERERGDGRSDFSFVIKKEFDQTINGTVELRRTPYLRRRHIADAHAMLDLVERRLDELEDAHRAALRRSKRA